MDPDKLLEGLPPGTKRFVLLVIPDAADQAPLARQAAPIVQATGVQQPAPEPVPQERGCPEFGTPFDPATGAGYDPRSAECQNCKGVPLCLKTIAGLGSVS